MATNKGKTYTKAVKVDELNTHNDVRKAGNNYGIYAYVRKSDDALMYVGKDSWINRGSRRSDHQSPKKVTEQEWHKVLQANPELYTYEVVAIAANSDWMDDIEAALIFNMRAIGQCEWNAKEEVQNVQQETN